MIVGGPMSTSAIRAGLVAVAQPRFLVDKSSVPLNASGKPFQALKSQANFAVVVGVKGSDKPILVFGKHDLVLNSTSGLEVHGGHNVAWSADGVVRFFDGVTAPVAKDAKLNSGCVVVCIYW